MKILKQPLSLSLSRKSMFAVAMSSLLVFSSCEKEDININQTVKKESYSEDSKEFARNIMKNTLTRYSHLSKDELFELVNPIRDQLRAKSKLLEQKSEEGIPIEDIFILYEGAINGSNMVIGSPQDGMETYDAYFLVDCYSKDGEYFIDVEDFNTLYGEIITEFQSEMQQNSNNYLALSDLTLYDFDGETAKIKMMYIIGTIPFQAMPLMPSGEIYGAEMEGFCTTHQYKDTMDAAIAIKGGANAQSQASNPNYCPPGTYVSYYGVWTYRSWDIQFANDIGYNYNLVKNYFWMDYTNSCIGDNSNPTYNDQIWQSWMDKAANFATAILPKIKDTTGVSNLEFYLTTLHSHHGPHGMDNYNPGKNYWHGGDYYFGVYSCY